jgi:hypothetical protein
VCGICSGLVDFRRNEISFSFSFVLSKEKLIFAPNWKIITRAAGKDIIDNDRS